MWYHSPILPHFNDQDEVMITAWRVASIPIWAAGFGFSFVALKVAIMLVTDPARRKDKLAEIGICLGFAVPFLIIAPWMWH